VDLQELQAELADYLTDDTLLAKANLLRRAEALDFITFLHDVLRMERQHTPVVQALHQQATQLEEELTAVNTHLFQQVRTAVQSGTVTGSPITGPISATVSI
jgi:hypothetical protein